MMLNRRIKIIYVNQFGDLQTSFGNFKCPAIALASACNEIKFINGTLIYFGVEDGAA